MMEPLRHGDRVALLTSGGDAPGMNAALRAAAKVGTALGLELLGVEEGYKGLMEGRVRALSTRALDEAARRGGTVLGSARSKRFMTAEGQALAQEAIIATRLSGLIVLGGNGSLAGARALQPAKTFDGRPLAIVGIPASIDNDIACTGMSIGVDTAMNTIVEACDRIADTAGSHQRTFIVEVMGRDCGYLAMVAGLAAQADVVLFPEAEKTESAIVDHVMQAIDSAYSRQGGRRHVLVIKSEGVRIESGRLKHLVDEQLGQRYPEGHIDTRVTVLGHVVRGGSPSAFDRMLATRLANTAVRALQAGETQVMAGWSQPVQSRPPSVFDPHVTLWPLEDVLRETHKLQNGDSSLVRWRVQALSQAEKILHQ
ncbi:MAG TPA: 6-phosphofructokinase [Pseudomonadota bacterium]|nr:6-phosphofructokinase [Pseudomonadota bacterium]